MNAPAMPTRPRILLFSSLYPSSARPGHGIVVANRLRELVRSDALDAKVVAPVPWFYSTDPKHGELALMARTPLRETLFDIETWRALPTCAERRHELGTVRDGRRGRPDIAPTVQAKADDCRYVTGRRTTIR